MLQYCGVPREEALAGEEDEHGEPKEGDEEGEVEGRGGGQGLRPRGTSAASAAAWCPR